MKMFKISIGCDHAGYPLKTFVLELLNNLGHEVNDRGCHDENRVDYPDFAALVAKDVQTKDADFGILICGTGVGMALSANKFKGIRAASLTDEYSTLMARKHNDLNVLCLGGRVIGLGTATLITETFLETEFEGGRHADRVNKISQLEK